MTTTRTPRAKTTKQTVKGTTMKPTMFRVLLDEGGTEVEHTVRILHGDMLRAELEGPQHGITDLDAQAMHFTTLWIWAALVRTKVTTKGFREFKPTLLQLDDVEDTGGESAGPTRPGARTS